MPRPPPMANDGPFNGHEGQPSLVSRNLTRELETFCFAESYASGLGDLGGSSEDEGDLDFASHYAVMRSPSMKERNPKAHRRLPPRIRSAIAEATPHLPEGSSSFFASATNLTKSLIGIGMLAVPRALADGTPAVSVGLLVLCGCTMAFTFFMLGYCAHLTGSTTLPQLWDATIGEDTAVLVELIIFTDTLLSCTAFALLIGDYASICIKGLLPWAPALLQDRSALILLVGLCLLLPLSLMRKLSLLSYSSLVGVSCTIGVFVYVVCDSSRLLFLSVAESSDDQELVAGLSAFEFRPGGLLKGMAIFSCAFMAHFQAPAYYMDLERRSPSRFAALCATAFGAAIFIYALFGLSGLLRFGDAIPGNALAGYPLSKPVILMFLGMSLSVAASFPLIFRGLREASLRLIGRASGRYWSSDSTAGTVVTTSMVLTVCLMATQIQDLSAAVGLIGSISGACLTLIFPGIMMMHIKKRKTPGFSKLAKVLVAFGFVQGLSSAFVVISRDIIGSG